MPNFANAVAETGGLILHHDSGSMADYFYTEDNAPAQNGLAIPKPTGPDYILGMNEATIPPGVEASPIFGQLSEVYGCIAQDITTGILGHSLNVIVAPTRAWQDALITNGCGAVYPELASQAELSYLATIACNQAPMMGAISSQLFGCEYHSTQVRLAQVRSQCEWLLLRCISSLRRQVIERLRSRLIELFQPDNWEGGDALPLAASFQHLLVFLGKQPELHTPGLTIADGHFVATWLSGSENLVRLQFDETGAVKWLILLSGVGPRFHPLQGVGWVSLDQLRSQLDVYGVRSWMASPSSL